MHASTLTEQTLMANEPVNTLCTPTVIGHVEKANVPARRMELFCDSEFICLSTCRSHQRPDVNYRKRTERTAKVSAVATCKP